MKPNRMDNDTHYTAGRGGQDVSAIHIKSGFSGQLMEVFFNQQEKLPVLIKDLQDAGIPNMMHNRPVPMVGLKDSAAGGYSQKPAYGSYNTVLILPGEDVSSSFENALALLEEKGHVTARFAEDVRSDLPEAIAKVDEKLQAAAHAERDSAHSR